MTAIIEKNINSENKINENIKPENINTENSVKNLFKNKAGRVISLHINNIQISEFMTRGNSLDEEHVQQLMTAIQEEGYLPGTEVWVNAITGTDGKILHYRLIAGRHRLEACRRLGMQEIPTLIFRDLTDKEECLADHLNNQKDSRHKEVTYMEEAMHCLYLHEKGWSLRQIARAKGTSKSNISRKLQMARLPKIVKDTFVGVPTWGQFPESYFRNICQLQAEAHQALICKKIIDKINTSKASNTIEKKPIGKSEVKQMVDELLLREAQGEIAEEALQLFKDQKLEHIKSIHIVKADEAKNINLEEEAWKKVLENIFTEEADRREKGMKYAIAPLWLKHCTEISKLSLSSFTLLAELISNDLRFNPERNDYFFITPGECYRTTEEYLAKVIKVNVRTLMKKILPSISIFIDYRKPGEVLKFRVNWNEVFELYRKNAHHIPFNDGGLSGIKKDYTGKIHPTPYHSIFIENGQVKQMVAAADKPAGLDLFQEELSPAHTPTVPADPEVKDRVEAEPEERVKAQPVAEIKAEPEVKPEVPPEQQTEEQKEEETQDIVDTACQAQEQNPAPEQEAETEEVTEEARETSRILRDAGMGKGQIDFCVSRRNIETTMNILKYLNEMTPQERVSIKNIPGYIYKMVRDGFTPPPGFVSYQEAQEKAERKKAIKLVGQTVWQSYQSGQRIFFCPKEGVAIPITTVPNPDSFVYHRDGRTIAASFADWPKIEYFGVQRE